MNHRAVSRSAFGLVATLFAVIALLVASPQAARAQLGLSFGFGSGRRGFYRHGGTSWYFSVGSYYPGFYPYYYAPYPRYVPIYREHPVVIVDRGGYDDYYLNRRSAPRDAEVDHAVADIERAFRDGDAKLLERHVADGEEIAIITDGDKKHKVKAPEYLGMTSDAFKHMKTIHFDLDRVTSIGHGEWQAVGVHELTDEEGKEKRFRVLFTLRKHDGRWIIRDVSAQRI